MSGDEGDLSGRWSGFYGYPDDGPPVPFDAELRESAGRVTGTTTEASDQPENFGQTLHAVLDGRRNERSVRFVKMYDDTSGGHDVVHYEGLLDAEANEIEGRWTIPGIWSGSFLMVRHAGAEQDEERTVAEEVR